MAVSSVGWIAEGGMREGWVEFGSLTRPDPPPTPLSTPPYPRSRSMLKPPPAPRSCNVLYI